MEETPAAKMPNRVSADAASRATPDSAETIRLRPRTAPATPVAVNARLARSSRPALPVSYGSPATPSLVCSRRNAASSIATPVSANRRAGPTSPAAAPNTPAPSRPAPAALASAPPAKANGSSGYASCHDGTAVSASRTAV